MSWGEGRFARSQEVAFSCSAETSVAANAFIREETLTGCSEAGRRDALGGSAMADTMH